MGIPTWGLRLPFQALLVASGSSAGLPWVVGASLSPQGWPLRGQQHIPWGVAIHGLVVWSGVSAGMSTKHPGSGTETGWGERGQMQLGLLATFWFRTPRNPQFLNSNWPSRSLWRYVYHGIRIKHVDFIWQPSLIYKFYICFYIMVYGSSLCLSQTLHIVALLVKIQISIILKG